MTKYRSANAVLFCLLLIGCGSSGPTDAPMLASGPIEPGSTITVFIVTELRSLTEHEVVTRGQPVEAAPITICGLTVTYWTRMVVATPDSPDLAGAINRRLYTAMPLPAGTRLLLTNPSNCTANPLATIFEGTVILGAQ